MLSERFNGGRDVGWRRWQTDGDSALKSLKTIFGESLETIESFMESGIFVMVVVVLPFVPDKNDNAQKARRDSEGEGSGKGGDGDG